MLSWVLCIWILLLGSTEHLQLHLKCVSSNGTQPFCKNQCGVDLKCIKAAIPEN